MHHALPPKRSRLAPKRIAAATAAALGAALLTYPGAATAQDTGIDCAVICTNHSVFSYGAMPKNFPLVVDTRNALKNIDADNIFRL